VKSKFGMKCIAVVAPLAMLLTATVCLAAAARTVDAGSKWEVAETTTLSTLTIGEGATVTAQEGRALTMTVDGAETPIKAGSYKGKIILTVAKPANITVDSHNAKTKAVFRAAVVVNNGTLVSDESVSAAAVGGTVTNTSADNVKITSVGPYFGGFILKGDTNYTIRKPVINLTGHGRNDFIGYGAAIRAGDNTKVTIDDAKIHNKGSVRTSIWVGDNANVTVNNADIEVEDGSLPSDYDWKWTDGGNGKGHDFMMEVPWMLGLIGKNRATLAVGHGTVTYNNSHIKAEAWGAMSTDAVEQVLITLNKCHVETVKSGYGAYADGDSMVHSSGTTFDVADYALIMSGGSGVFTDGSVVNSRRFAVMAHGGSSGKLTIEKGSVFNTDEAVLQLKSSSPDIVIDNSKLVSKKGIILEMFPNDDPNKMMPSGGDMGSAAGGPGGAGGTMPGGAGTSDAGGPGTGGTAAGPGGATGGPGGTGGAMPGGTAGGPGGMSGKYAVSNGTNDEFTTIKNSTLKGDFINALTNQSAMNVSLENSTVTGAITTATYEHAVGKNGEKLVMQDSSALYYLIGEVNETPAPTTTAHGATVKLDGKSKWFVSKTSYLTGLTVAEGATVAAPQGGKLTMTVDGVEAPISAGSYKGKIVLSLAN
jgi:hypothetical protein